MGAIRSQESSDLWCWGDSGRGAEGAFWGTCYLLFLDQGAGYMSVSFVKLHQALHL